MNKEQLFKWRTDRGIKQTTLAEMAGISSGYLSSLESGHYGITRKADRKLSRAMALYDEQQVEDEPSPVQKTFEDDAWVSQTAEALRELEKLQEGFAEREKMEKMLEEIAKTPAQIVPKGSVARVDMVNNPNHYADRQYEVIDVMKDTMKPERFIGYLEGTVIKYMMRWDKKFNPAEDLEKAELYLRKLIENIKEEQ